LNKRKVIKGEKHHWWPKGLSKYWANEKGLVHRIDYSGKVIPSNPKEFGQISNGHNIIFENESPWDSTIEHYFDEPDRSMPRIISWLESIKSNAEIKSVTEHLHAYQEEDVEYMDILRECIISLIVRSPKYRNAQNAFVESFRGKLEKKESKLLIASNIHQKYKTLVQDSKGAGKFALLFSEKYEFIFGDGFYSNINSSTDNIFGLKVLIPMTPHIAVIWSSPMAYRTHPRIISNQADKKTIEIVNNSVQVCSKEYLFFRSQMPILCDDFKYCEHRVYDHKTDPVGVLINSLILDESRTTYGFSDSV